MSKQPDGPNIPEDIRAAALGMIGTPEQWTRTMTPINADALPSMDKASIHQREKEWAETELGKLFWAFERAHGTAWREDTILGERDCSSRAAKGAWDREAVTRRAFLTALRGW